MFHETGSSHGDSRIYRQATGEGSFYTPLAIRSLEIIKKLEHRTNFNLFTRTGVIILADSSGNVSLHGNKDFIGETIRSAQTYGIYHEILDSKGVGNISPHFNISDDGVGYYERGAGFLRPDNCIKAQLSQALLNGAQIHSKEKVISIESLKTGHIIIKTEDRDYNTKKVIVCAGPWIGKILGRKYENLFQVHRQVLYWFGIEDYFLDFTFVRFPVFIWLRGCQFLYGFPAINGRHGGMKISSEVDDLVDIDTIDRNVSERETKEMLEKVKQFFPALKSSSCLKSQSCLYTETSDRHFIIDHHPEMPNVIIASPCSGYGFKHSTAIGEILSQIVLDGKSQLDISHFSLKRFEKAS